MSPIRNLFLKIFLSFWATVILIGLVIAITWALQLERVLTRWKAMSGEVASFYAQSAAEEVDRNGVQALNVYLDRLNKYAHVARAEVLMPDGNVIAGQVRNVPADLISRATQSKEPQFTVGSGASPSFVAKQVVGPSGQSYVFVSTLPAGPFSYQISATTELIRLGLALLISGVICYLLARYLTKPIIKLRQAASQLGAGDLKARADGAMQERRDELGDLVKDFNRMADRIESLVGSQKQLISDISHELRSPLARLTVALELARQSAGEEAKEELDRIELEAERLNSLIGNLLTLARLEGVSSSPDRSEVNLKELVSSIVEDANFEAHALNREVRVNSLTDCTAQGSPELLRSAIENVVRNAVRYTSDGSAVDIDLSCRNGDHSPKQAVIRVRDHGPGVPNEELANIFRPFYRLTTARDRQSGGAGLGLAITNRGVQLHGGSVNAQNASDNGGGLIVELQLPIE